MTLFSCLLTPTSDLKPSRLPDLRYAFEKYLQKNLQQPTNNQIILFNCACCMLQFRIFLFRSALVKFSHSKNCFSLFSLNLWSIINNKSALTIEPICNAKSLAVTCINLVNVSQVHLITETVSSGAHVAQMWLWTPSCYSPSHGLRPADHPLPGTVPGIKAFINRSWITPFLNSSLTFCYHFVNTHVVVLVLDA